MQRNITLPTCRTRRNRLGLAVALLALLVSASGGAPALSDGLGAAGSRQPTLAAEILPGSSSDSRMVPGCRALTCDLVDWDGDGICTIYDFYDFAADFAAGDPSTDLDCNGTIDSDDYFLFLDLFAACC